MTDYNLPILITGAAGSIGSVGRTAAELLLKRGYKVRAHVRTDDDRAAALRNLGAEIVVGDLLDLEAVHRAVEGCERVYFSMSLSPSYLEATANMAAVAKHYGVKAFVNMSQMTVKEMDVFNTTSSPQQKQHWLAEQILEWSGLPVVTIRPTAFLEALYLQNASAVGATGRILAPFGSGKNSAIAAYDVARVVAEVLSDPEKHVGNTYHLTGPVSQDMESVAKEFSEALGREITYTDVPVAIWKEKFASFGLPLHTVSHVTTMAELHKANRYDRYSDDVEKVTGVRPMSVKDFVEKHAKAFSATAQ